MALYYKKTKQDQEVGSKDGIVDAWYERLKRVFWGEGGFVWE